jgi:hypothetical protein
MTLEIGSGPEWILSMRHLLEAIYERGLGSKDSN